MPYFIFIIYSINNPIFFIPAVYNYHTLAVRNRYNEFYFYKDQAKNTLLYRYSIIGCVDLKHFYATGIG